MTKRKLATLTILFGILAVLASSALFQDVFQRLTETLNVYVDKHFILGPIVFIFLAALSVLLGPFSSAPLVPSAVVIWGTDRTLLFLLTGWLLGNSTAYAIGYYVGNPVIKRLLIQQTYETWIQKFPRTIDISFAFLFRLAMPSETGYIFGTLKYNFFKYFFVTIFAELPFAILTVFAGDAFADAGWLAFLGLAAIWLFLVFIAFRMLQKKIRRLEANRLQNPQIVK